VYRLPFGLLMLARGVIDESQLKTAVETQRQQPQMKIGRCLESLGAVTGAEITRTLGAQHCVPVLVGFEPELDGGVPLALLESSRCIVFRGNYHPEMLYVGFEVAIDRPLLSAIEQVLGCRCEPCIVDGAIIGAQIEHRQRQRNPDEILFATPGGCTEVARSIHSYALQVRADTIRVASTRHHYWARVKGFRQLDLLFRSAD